MHFSLSIPPEASEDTHEWTNGLIPCFILDQVVPNITTHTEDKGVYGTCHMLFGSSEELEVPWHTGGYAAEVPESEWDDLDVPEYLIAINIDHGHAMICETILHEVTHIQQMAHSRLFQDTDVGLTVYNNNYYDDTVVAYEDQPWEHEANSIATIGMMQLVDVFNTYVQLRTLHRSLGLEPQGTSEAQGELII